MLNSSLKRVSEVDINQLISKQHCQQRQLRAVVDPREIWKDERGMWFEDAPGSTRVTVVSRGWISAFDTLSRNMCTFQARWHNNR